uniref:Uncharacterized protein n=1 Tax=Arundo donax TaxID=35708 RepID=A0A0A9H4J6_ARUDO
MINHTEITLRHINHSPMFAYLAYMIYNELISMIACNYKITLAGI